MQRGFWSEFRVLIVSASICLLAGVVSTGRAQFASGNLTGAGQDSRPLARQALEQALRATEKHSLAGDRSALTRRIAIIMSRIDPEAAAGLCAGISRASDAIRALGEVAAAVAPRDQARAQELIATATRLLRDLRNDHQRSAETSFLYGQLAAFDPRSALQVARETKEAAVLEYVWAKVAQLAPRTAAEELRAHPPPPAQRVRLTTLLLPHLASVDLAAALLLSEEVSEPLAKSQALAQICFSLPASDGLAVAQRIPDDLLRAQAIRAAAEKLAPTNLPAAREAIAALPADRESALAGIALAAASADVQQALALISGISHPRVRQDALGLFLMRLASEDLAAACRVADSCPEMPAWALPALCSALARTDLRAARGRARAISDPLSRDLALRETALVVVQTSPAEAEEILLEVKEPKMRLPALRALVRHLAVKDVEKACSLVGLAGDAEQVQALLLEIARSCGMRNLPLALRLAETCPASPEKAEAFLDIAEAIAPVNLKQALGIAGEVLGESAAAQALAARLVRQQPDLAMACASEITDPLRRASAFCDIAEALLGAPGLSGGLPGLARPEVQRVVEPGGPVPADSGLFAASDSRVEILCAQPHELRIRLLKAEPGSLYTLRYQGSHSFCWENLRPGSDGTVTLRDDRHLRPEQRLRCPSRGTEADPAFFDDFTKADSLGKRRVPFGIPVSTFGGPGYLSSAPAWLHRDRRGGLWLYQDLRPWRIVAFDTDFNYRFTLVFPGRILALDSDPEANLYVLQEGNLLSRFDANGRPTAHWRLPEGRGRGEFIQASGLALDHRGEYLYLADEKSGRVQRFDPSASFGSAPSATLGTGQDKSLRAGTEMRLTPFPFVPWGWIGREDLAYLELGAYQPESKYRLDRPRRLALGPGRLLYVDCAYYVMCFDLTSGEQVSFGPNEVLGWGGSFSDSPHSVSAANNGHWQYHWLAGVDAEGNLYISDEANAYVSNLRLQCFSPKGEFSGRFDVETDLRDAEGKRAYIVPPLGLCFDHAQPRGERRAWLVEGGGRVYESIGLGSGGRFYLGPGAPGKQFDLTLARPEDFVVEKQDGWLARRTEGLVIGYNPGRHGIRNCEAEQGTTLANGATSIWIPVRLGEPFRVILLEEGREIPPSDYIIEIEEQPGPFGTKYDFFRVTNKSGHTWKNVRFIAETTMTP